MIYDGESWVAVPGYEVVCATGAHGVAGGAPHKDKWPHRLDELSRSERLEVLGLAEPHLF